MGGASANGKFLKIRHKMRQRTSVDVYRFCIKKIKQLYKFYAAPFLFSLLSNIFKILILRFHQELLRSF